MRLTVVGGSRGTGAHLARRALAAGNEVTVLSRSGGAPDGARVVTGDATDTEVVRRAVEGADAVVVTVGGARGVRRQRAAVTETVVQAMRATDAHRVVVQSSLGAGGSGSLMPLPVRLLMKALLAPALADHDAQERVITGSGLDWTVVRPTGLTDRPGTGSWRTLEVGDDGYLGGTVPREDLAALLLEVAGDLGTVGRAIGVSS